MPIPFHPGGIVIAGLGSVLYDQPPAQAGAADREAYYYPAKKLGSHRTVRPGQTEQAGAAV
jgi:hypothetical protein